MGFFENQKLKVKQSRIKAGALPYAILVMLLIVTVCSMLMIAHYIGHQFYKKEEILTKLNDNIQSAANMVLADPGLFNTGDSIRIILYNDTVNSVHVIKKRWGFFELYSIKAKLGGKSTERLMYTGIGFNKESDPVLYLVNRNNYLYTCGETIIKGNSYVPGGIIKPGHIEGIGYVNNLKREGKIFESDSYLPEMDESTIKSISGYFEQEIGMDSVLDYDNLKYKIKDIDHSFKKNTLLLSSNSDMLIEDCRVKGNVILYAGRKVEIQPTADLQGIIVIAPYVLVKKAFKGNLQIFAKDSAVIEDDCILSYPSVVASTGDSAFIKINAVVEGGIIQATSGGTSNNRLNSIVLGKNAETIGIIYTQGNLEPNGKSITGSVYCNNFIFRNKSSKYNNFLVYTELNSFDIPDFYFAPMVFKNKRNKKVIEWLD